jgi:hypothetical protein
VAPVGDAARVVGETTTGVDRARLLLALSVSLAGIAGIWVASRLRPGDQRR